MAIVSHGWPDHKNKDRDQEWVRKPRVKSSNKYPNYTEILDLTLNPSAICSHFPLHVAAPPNA